MDVSSYYVPAAGIAIDPMEPDGGLDAFDRFDLPPQQVVLTIGLHWRASDRFRERFGATVRAPEAGMHRFEGSDRRAEPYSVGEELGPGVTAIGIGGIAPDDMAMHIDHGEGAVAFADALIRYEGQLGFVPDDLWGDDPRAEQRAVRDSLRRVLERRFDTLLFAHGDPLVGGGHAALRDFVAKPVGEEDFGHTA